MKKINYYITSVLLILSLNVTTTKAQTGPGGVGKTDGTSKLGLWLNASKGVQDASSAAVVDGANVTYWRDQSGNGLDAQQTTALIKPNYNATGMGGQPTINFTLADKEYLTGSYTFQEDLHTFVVGSSNTVLWSSYGLLGSSRSNNGFIYHTSLNTKSTQIYSISSTVGYINLEKVTPTDIMVPVIYDASLDHTSGSVTYDIGYNGSSKTGIVTQTRTSSTRPILFGKDDCCGDRNLDGKIAETIYYDEKLNSAEEIIVNNYLAAKYGINLSANDFYNEDDAGAGNFDHNVAGIGRVNASNLHTDSKGTGLIQINTPSALSDGDFLFWGEKKKNATYNFVSSETGYRQELNTKWRVSKTGDLGTVSISINASDIDLSGKIACATLNILIDNDSDFSSPEKIYPFSESGGVYTATDVDFSDNDYFVIEYHDEIVLEGATAYNGFGTLRKPNRLDDCYKLLVKTNTLTLSEDADVKEIEIESGAILAVDNGIRLQVTNGIDNNGDLRLVGTSQLVQTHTSAANLNLGTGNLVVDQQATTTTQYQSGYWSSPVSASIGAPFSIYDVLKDGTVATAATPSIGEAVPINFTDATIFDGNTAISPISISGRWLATLINLPDWTRFVSATDPVLTPGLGWNMKSYGANFTFKGKPNDGDYSFTIDQNKFSLLGNPYPSALNSTAFIDDNASQFDGILYIWDSTLDNTHVRGNYAGSYSTIISGVGVGSGLNLPIGQGFIISREDPGSGTVTFKNSQRTLTNLADTDVILAKSSKENKNASTINLPVLKIGFQFNLTDTKKYNRQVAVAFRGLSNNYNKGFDAEMWGLQPTDLFLKVNDKDVPFIITSVEDFNKTLEIPLTVQLDVARSVTFSLDDIQHIKSNVYLLDKLTTTYYNLSNGPKGITLPVGKFTDRFFIVFQQNTLATENQILNNAIKIQYNKNAKQLIINNNANTTINKIAIYNILGQKIIEESNKKVVTKKEIVIKTNKLKNALNIVLIETDMGVISKKIL